MKRRDLLRGALGGAAAAVLGRSTATAADGLWTHGQRCGVRYGAAIRPTWLKDDPPYAAAVAAECNIVTTEGRMAWTAIEAASTSGRLTSWWHGRLRTESRYAGIT